MDEFWIRFGLASATSGVICSGHLWSLFQPESLGDAKNTSRTKNEKNEKSTEIATDSDAETGYDGRGRCPENIYYIEICKVTKKKRIVLLR